MFKLQANKVKLFLTEAEEITSGSSGNIYECKFCFSDEWYGMLKTVVFHVTKNRREVMVKIPLNSDTNTCMIPAQVLTNPGVDLYCGVYGKRGDIQTMPTKWVNLGKIKQGVDMGDDCQTPVVTGVTSFNYRTGDVMPQSGDYTPDMIGAVATEGGTVTDSLNFMVKNEEELPPGTDNQTRSTAKITRSTYYTQVGSIEVTAEGVMLHGLKTAKESTDAVSLNQMETTVSNSIGNIEAVLKTI